jgi:altronate dehydratase
MVLNKRNIFESEKEEKEKEVKMPEQIEKIFKKESIDIYTMKEFYLAKQDDGMLDRIDKLIAAFNKDMKDTEWVKSKKVKIQNLGKDYSCGRWSAKSGDTVEVPDFEAKRVLADFPKNWKVV